MIKSYNGFCEEQKCNYVVSREYIDTSDLSEKSYQKGLLDCKYAGRYGCKYFDKNKKCSVEE